VDTIALVPDSEVFDLVTTENGESWPDTDVIRLGPSTDVSTNGARVVLGTNEQRFELREYRGDSLSRIVRVEQAAERVPADAGDRVRAIVSAEMDRRPIPASAKADFERMLAAWRFATVFPFHDRLLTGTDGTLWAEAPSVWPTDAQRYLVFDAEGRAVARVRLPERVTPHVVSLERVLGVWRDDDDVPHVRAWRLRELPAEAETRRSP
jgi:hypothetical protein